MWIGVLLWEKTQNRLLIFISDLLEDAPQAVETEARARLPALLGLSGRLPGELISPLVDRGAATGVGFPGPRETS